MYAVRALRQIPFHLNTNVFHFDTEIILQLLGGGWQIVERPIPTYYGNEISRVNGLAYAWNVVKVTLQFGVPRNAEQATQSLARLLRLGRHLPVVVGEEGELVDCPNVFRHDGRWYMMYVANKDKVGYETYLARYGGR